MTHHAEITRRFVIMAIAAAVLCAAGTARASAPADTSTTIRGGETGKTFESITVEGEDKVRVEFAKPALDVAIDPASAPGLDWDNFGAVLQASYLDAVAPFFARSAFDRSPYRARAWLEEFRSGDVARFRPEVEGVDRWSLTVADSRSKTVAAFAGKGKPPKEIAWDGRDPAGHAAPAGLTYSYVLEAVDEAGNKRSFAGEGFELPPYVYSGDAGTALVFPSSALDEGQAGGAPPAVLLDAATRLNQGDPSRPIVVDVSAPAFPEARSTADRIVADLRTLVLGDPARVTATTHVEAGTRGGVTITVGKPR